MTATLSRPPQLVPSSICNQLLAVIRNQFYPNAPLGGDAAKQWFQDQAFIKRRGGAKGVSPAF